MKTPRTLPCLLLIPALLAGPVAARDDVPPPPPLLDDSDQVNRELLEPQVTITRQGGTRISEYRIQGELYMLRVEPEGAPTYYMVDADGDGRLESRMNELDPRILIPSWVLFRF
ncbi:MAG: DUF2782 domain-containing protein [Ectothiorhodospira sp.]